MCNSKEAVPSCCERLCNRFLVNNFTTVMHSNGNCCRKRSSGWWVEKSKLFLHLVKCSAGVTKMSRNRSRSLSCVVSSLVLVLAARSNSALAQAVAPGPPQASSFPGPLWEVMTPVGGTVSVTNAHLTINVPGGSNHDTLLPSNQAVRVVQPVGNENFDVSIKIDSPIVASAVGTSQGLMVLADDQNFITFALVTDGTNISLTAHKVSGGVAATVLDVVSFNEYR